MINYSKIESISAEPEASSMIETFRAIGYSVETAIADIIDNSISAEAKNIWVDYSWNGPDTVISITDDGFGMTNDTLIQAMKPGSVSPLTKRRENDLGRFGLGLKTASFSQCRKFCVISKTKDTPIVYWSWDLDYVNYAKAWKLIKFCPDIEGFKQKLGDLNSCTTVIWHDIDRLTKNTSSGSVTSKAKFLETMERVKKHLSMVFHRYMEEGLNVFFRGRKIAVWDPFMIGYEGLQPKPETVLEGGKIRIKGFILPHRSKLTTEQYNYGKGPEDSWTAHQGFYVYRNKRLLVAGDWLGIFKKEVHYDLCRISVDLPNTMDDEWQVDIKKSIARPPGRLKEQLLSVAKEARGQALEVYRHKGKVIKRKLIVNEYFPFWEERTRHGKRFYKLNRNHPLLKELFQKNNGLSGEIEKVLQFIEETVPVPLITLKENENEFPHGQPFEGKNQQVVSEVMKIMYENMISEGVEPEQAKARIANIEPFNFYLEFLEQL
ncbi:ATP-binding protein [Rapidithrix thailandica]|uniref:ATP-binding protein n=1 Tax=Rapidithrix thailandica TaxID=413964 RepID=A0AAW9SJ88_9BACT